MNIPNVDYQKLKECWRVINAFAKKITVYPRTAALFTERYGSFVLTAEVDNFLNALNAIQAVITQTGNADDLKQSIIKNPDYLTASGMPGDLYAKTIWLANQVANSADVIITAMRGWKAMLHLDAGSTDERAAHLTASVTGIAGINSRINAIAGYAETIAESAASDSATFQKAFLAISGTKLLSEANETLGRIEVENNKLQGQLDKLEAKKSGWLANKSKIEKEIDELNDSIANNNIEANKKRQLTTELDTPFFITGNKITTTLDTIRNDIAAAGRSFSDYSGRLAAMTKISSPEQLADYDWVATATDLNANIVAWERLKEASTDYAVNMFAA